MAKRLEFNPITDPAELDRLSKQAEEIWKESYDYYYVTDGWKVNKEGSDGAVIYAKQNKKGKTIFKMQARIKWDLQNCVKKMFGIEEFEKVPEWNTTHAFTQIFQKLDPETHIAYQVTTPTGPGGIVSARDVTVLRREKWVDGKFILGNASIKLDQVPPQKNIVRAEGFPSLILAEPSLTGDPNECYLTVVLDMDFKLTLIPTAVFNQVFQYLLFDNLKCIRDAVEKMKA
jgi:hypothetical protein